MNETLNKRFVWLPATIYMVVWLFCVGWFWLGMDGGGWIMAYTILAFMVLMPLAALVSAFLLAWKRPLGGWFLGALVLYGTLNFAAIAATFMLSTGLGITRLASPDILIFLLDMVPGAVGLCLGWLFRVRGWGLKRGVTALLVLLAVCYVYLKSLNGSILRPVLILDVPALVFLVIGLWFLLKKNKTKKV